MMRKFVLVSFILFLIISLFPIVLAENWVEVSRYTGSGLLMGNSEPFTVDHINWRIKWDIESAVNGTDIGVEQFDFYVESHFDNQTIGSVTPPTEKNGTLNFNWVSGTFHLSFPPHVLYYTIIVEQNIDPIPEFPSWIILPLFLTATLIGILVRKRLVRTR